MATRKSSKRKTTTVRQDHAAQVCTEWIAAGLTDEQLIAVVTGFCRMKPEHQAAWQNRLDRISNAQEARHG